MYRIARAKIKEFQRRIGKNVLDKKKIKADLKFENIKKISRADAAKRILKEALGS